MTNWHQLDHGPEKRLSHWQRKARVLAKKAAREGQPQTNMTWRIWAALLVVVTIVYRLLENPTYRHWLIAALANIAIIGGIVAAPVISVVAWIGVALPVHAPLHQAAPTLFIGAMLWLVMGFVSAHARGKDALDQ